MEARELCSRVVLFGENPRSVSVWWHWSREAQAEGAYREALERCSRAASLVWEGPIGSLEVAAPLAAAVESLYGESLAQLAAALLAVCSDFHPGNCEQVPLTRPSPDRCYL